MQQLVTLGDLLSTAHFMSWQSAADGAQCNFLTAQRRTAQQTAHVLAKAADTLAENNKVDNMVDGQERVEKQRQPFVCDRHEQRQRAANGHWHLDHVVQSANEQQRHRRLPGFACARTVFHCGAPHRAYVTHPAATASCQNQPSHYQDVQYCN